MGGVDTTKMAKESDDFYGDGGSHDEAIAGTW